MTRQWRWRGLKTKPVMNFSEQLKAELDRLNLTQAEGADILGVSPRTVWKWLHGQEPLAVTAEGVIARLNRLTPPGIVATAALTSLPPNVKIGKMKTFTSEDFEKWGAQGGKARKVPRKLSIAQARRMVVARAKKHGETLHKLAKYA